MIKTFEFTRFESEEVELKFVNESYSLNKNIARIIEECWNQETVKKPALTDNQLINLNSIQPNQTLILGNSWFKDYYCMRKLLEDEIGIESWNITKEDIINHGKVINPLSTFPAIVVEDFFIMAKKNHSILAFATDKNSFPGGGFLEFKKDVIRIKGKYRMKPLNELLFREINEETGLQGESIKNFILLGVGKDTYKNSHWNPAIFSIQFTDINLNDFERARKNAPDAQEFKEPYIFIPVNDPDLLSALIHAAVNDQKPDLPRKYVQRILNYKGTEFIITGKSLLMLLEIGKYFHGEKWYSQEIKKHEKHLKIT